MTASTWETGRLRLLVLLVLGVGGLAAWAAGTGGALAHDSAFTDWWTEGTRGCRPAPGNQHEDGNRHWTCIDSSADYWTFHMHKSRDQQDAMRWWVKLKRDRVPPNGNVREDREKGKPDEDEKTQTTNGAEECAPRWDGSHSTGLQQATLTEQWYLGGGGTAFAQSTGRMTNPYARPHAPPASNPYGGRTLAPYDPYAR